MNEGPYTDIPCNGTPAEPKKISEVEHYLVMRIRQPKETDPRRRTPIALIRLAIHDAMEEHGLDAGDIVLRGDVDHGESYQAVAGVYSKAVERAQEYRRPSLIGRGPERTPEEKAHRANRSRAQRAALVIERYIEKYGDDLGLSRSQGKHAETAPSGALRAFLESDSPQAQVLDHMSGPERVREAIRRDRGGDAPTTPQGFA
jgi:hypothetical protein